MWPLGFKTRSFVQGFFDDLKLQNIQSYRMYTIVDNDLIEDKNFIVQMKGFIEDLAKRKDESIHLCLQFWISPECNREQIHNFSTELGSETFIQYERLDDVLQYLIAKKNFPIILLENPLSDLTRNILLFWTLDDDFDINVYIDSSVWKKYSNFSKNGLASSSAFGLSKKSLDKNKFWMYYEQPSADKDSSHVFLLQNKILIGYSQNLSIQFIKSYISKEIEKNTDRIHQILSFPLKIGNPLYTLDNYQKEFTKRMQYFKNNPQETINDRFWISQFCGEIFLETLREQGLGLPFSLGLSSGSMRKEESLLSTSDKILLRSSYSDIKESFGPQAEQALERALFVNDASFLCENTDPKLSQHIQTGIRSFLG